MSRRLALERRRLLARYEARRAFSSFGALSGKVDVLDGKLALANEKVEPLVEWRQKLAGVAPAATANDVLKQFNELVGYLKAAAVPRGVL